MTRLRYIILHNCLLSSSLNVLYTGWSAQTPESSLPQEKCSCRLQCDEESDTKRGNTRSFQPHHTSTYNATANFIQLVRKPEEKNCGKSCYLPRKICKLHKRDQFASCTSQPRGSGQSHWYTQTTTSTVPEAVGNQWYSFSVS